MDLSSYSNALGLAQGALPNFDDADNRRVARQSALLGNEAQRQDMAARQQQAVYQDQQRRAFQGGLSDLGDKPTPEKLYRMSARFPEFATAIQKAADGINAADQAGVVRRLAPIQALIANNRPADAAAEMKRHIDADKAAGIEPDEDDVHLYERLSSGDPEHVKAAGAIVYGLLTALNPETAAKNLTDQGGDYTLAPGSKRFDAGGNLIASADFAPDRFTLGPGDTRFNGSSEGGDPASGGGGRADGSWNSFHANFLGPTEGGYANRDGASGAPVNFGVNQKYNPDIDVKGLTPEQGKAILYNRYWKPSGADGLRPGLAEIQADTAVNMGVSTAKRLLKASGGDPERYLQLREARYRSIGGKDLGNWLNRNNKLREYVGLQDGAVSATGGSARAVASVAAVPKEGYTMLSPGEMSAAGLDPNGRYQRSPNGQVSAIGGQSKGSAGLKPIPNIAVKGIQETRGTLRQIDEAIAAIKNRPQSIGLGTGALGDSFTQFNDPEGTATRSAVGKIGGQIIHDVSGAAVTLSEAPRFKPYVPLVTDRPGVALAKLTNLRKLAQGNLADLNGYYSEDQGYKSYSSQSPRRASPSGFRILGVRKK